MTSIFVAKLDFNVTDVELKSLFEEHGKVNRVTIAKDKETGKPRGFAFVEMFDEAEAEKAINALDNYAINGRNIAVKKADDRGATNKPQGDRENKFKERPAFRGGDQTKKNYSSPSENRSPSFSNLEDHSEDNSSFEKPNFPQPKVVERKKEKEKEKKSSANDAPKKTKMSAYKKSGKSDRFMDDDEGDDDLDFYYNRNKSESWDDEEEDD